MTALSDPIPRRAGRAGQSTLRRCRAGDHLGRDCPACAPDGLHHGHLSGPAVGLGPTRDRRCLRHRPALLRRSGDRGRPVVRVPSPMSSGATSRTSSCGRPPGPGKRGKLLSTTTIRHRLGLLRTFFERIIEWGYDDAPARVPIFPGDFPKADEPLPKFLDDRTMAKFMAAVAKDTNPRRRLMMELLARTGMRVGRAGLTRGRRHGPDQRDLLAAHPGGQAAQRPLRAAPPHPGRPHHRLPENRGTEPFGPIWWSATTASPSTGGRSTAMSKRSAKRAGVGHVHPHQLRHTLATQAINRGMSLEAIAALLGHRSMRMTMTYARISDRTVADEYFRVTEAVEANYGRTEALPDTAAGANMRRLAADHRRMLGNGMCTRPVALGCSFESACERCNFFETGPQFIPILQPPTGPRHRTRPGATGSSSSSGSSRTSTGVG